MKRAGNLMSRIAHSDNLCEAFLRAARGKGDRREVQVYRENILERTSHLSEELLDGSFQWGDYHRFTIYDPKKRTICAAPFRDRVVMHAMMRICHPVFEQYQIYDSYASRIDKGVYKALDRVQQYARRYEWFLKLDFVHYFDSIDHKVMAAQLARLFKDPFLLQYLQAQLDGYEVSPGRGLPIGNLTSQYMANHYLSVGDHYLKEQLRVPAMVRYMDDIIIFAHTKEQLATYCHQYTVYATEHLHLELHPPVCNRVARGVPFLGYVVYPSRVHLAQRSRHRFRRKLQALSSAYEDRQMDEQKYRERMTALYAFTLHADSFAFRRKILEQQGALP